MPEINKVVFGSETLIDLSQDTVTASTLFDGVTAHDASGELILGSYYPNAYYRRLWTNSSPSSTFGAQDVTLSWPIAKRSSTSVAWGSPEFPYLRIVWAYSNSLGVTADNWQTVVASGNVVPALSYTYELTRWADMVSGNTRMFMGAVHFASSYAYIRRCWFVFSSTDTTVTTLHFDQVDRSNNANHSTSMMIPILVDGVLY